jgi:hypothetical protein
MDSEARALMATLDHQRSHVLDILEGLSDQALRQPVLPTGWSCVGLVRHLAVDVERWWFRQVLAGEAIDPGEPGADAPAWTVPDGVAPGAVLDLYRHEIQLANDILTSTSPETEPAAWPVEIWPDWRYADMREITLHVIAETACHAGHLDATRELLDGRTYLVLE